MPSFWSTVEPILAALRPRVIVTVGVPEDEARAALGTFARDHGALLEPLAGEPGAGTGERAVQAMPRAAVDADAVLVEVTRLDDRLEALLALLDQLSPAVAGGFPLCLLHGGGPETGQAADAFVGITSRDLGAAPVPGHDELWVVCEQRLVEPVLGWAAARSDGDGATDRAAELERELAAREGEINVLEGLLSQREDYLAALEMALTEQADQLHATWSSAYWRLTAPLRRAVTAYRDARARLRARGGAAQTVTIPLASLDWEEVQADLSRARPARWRRAPEIGMRAPWRLEQVVPSRVVYRLDAPPGTTVAAGVAVHSRAWAPAQSAVRAQLHVLDSHGATLHRAGAQLDPRQRDRAVRRGTLAAPLPAGPCRVVLEAEADDPGGARATVAWQDLHVSVPAAEAPAAPETPARRAPTIAASERKLGRGPEPTISVVLPVHDPPPHFLRSAIESVLAQTHEGWQLCIADDGSRDPRVVEMLGDYAARDRRIVLLRNEQGGGISAGSNAALSLATQEFVALFDHDDELHPEALERVVAHLREHPDADIVYTDEDRMLGDGSRFGAILKPDWSPDLLRAGMYTCHLGVYRRRLVEEVGGFRSEFDGSQDFDLMLRLVERTDRVGHVPEVLYHWRASDASVALNPMAKPYAYEAGRRAVQEHLERTGVRGRAYRTHLPGLYGIHHEVDPDTTVSIVVVAGAAEAERMREGVAACTRHPSWDLVAVAAEPGEALGAALTRGVRQATGEYALLVAQPCVPREDAWLDELLGFAARPGVGVAGAKVLSPDGTIAHGGVVVGDGLPLAAYRGVRGDYMGYLGTLEVPANFSAVAGALAVRRERVLDLGDVGPYASPVAEADLCLRAGRAGLRTVLVPAARLELLAPPTEGPPPLADLAAFKRAWAPALPRDPYYHPDLWQQRVMLPAPPIETERVVPLVAPAQAEDREQERREEDLDPHDDQRGRPHGQALL